MVADRASRRLQLCYRFLRWGREFFGNEFFLGCAATTAGFANQKPAAEAVGAFVLDYTGSVADIALHHAFLSSQFTCAFAFIAFGGQGAGAFALSALNLAFTITSGTYQK